MHHSQKPSLTAREIRRECEVIQATWTDQERRKRAGFGYQKVLYTIPMINLTDAPELQDALSESDAEGE